jgi:hypothetical protein
MGGRNHGLFPFCGIYIALHLNILQLHGPTVHLAPTTATAPSRCNTPGPVSVGHARLPWDHFDSTYFLVQGLYPERLKRD